MDGIRNGLRSVRSGLRALNDAVARVEGVLVSIVLGFMILVAIANVVGRWLRHGILWAEPVLKHVALLIAFLGGSLATKEGRHISIDLFSRFLPHAALVAVHLVVSLGAAVVCGVLTRAAWLFQATMREEVTSPFWGLEPHHVTLMIPIGFALLTGRFALRFVDLVLGALLQEDLDVGGGVPHEVTQAAAASSEGGSPSMEGG